jgi:heme-degrading monooxygenase HmoA
MDKVVMINVFKVKQGRLDDFVELQRQYLGELSDVPGALEGWRGSRLHRAVDGADAVMISVFDSMEAHKRLIGTARFAEHREKVAALIESAEPRYYSVAYEAGTI